LEFDSELKEETALPGATNIMFRFAMTNAAADELVIERVLTSCGCTTPRMPSLPWILAPGTNVLFEIDLDIRGKHGQLNKAVYLYTSKGFKGLGLRAHVPSPSEMTAEDRLRNLQISAADRQAVFKGDCARCHATPAHQQVGRSLFNVACGICHEAEHRAEMVPDLAAQNNATGPEYWRRWITHGKSGTLMPAFTKTEGGPLTEDQIETLVDFLAQRYPAADTPITP
jgi:mono/diheme cytochrome c family protein